MNALKTDRIQRFFYILAFFNLASILVTLWVTRALIQNFRDAIQQNRAWAARLGTYAELNRSASQANAPGNDVFDSRDIPAESQRLDLAAGDFQRRLALAREELRRSADPAEEPLREDLDALDQGLGAMLGEAHKIFTFLKHGDDERAGARMATMDREFARMQDAGRTLERHVREIQLRHLAEQATTAGTLQRYQLLVSALLCLAVLAVVLFGRTTGQALRRGVTALTAAEAESRALLDQIAQRNRDLRLILDNVHQGFLTLTPEGNMSPERSAIVDRWFGPHRDQTPFWDCVRPISPAFASAFQLGFEALQQNLLPQELLLDQMPRRLALGNRHLQIEYHLVAAAGEGGDQARERLMLVVNDITSTVEREKAEQEQQALMAAVQRLLFDREGYMDFHQELDALMRRALAEPPPPPAELRRLIHTIKGNASTFDLAYLSTLCHGIEARLLEDGGGLTATERVELETRWERLDGHLRKLLHTDKSRRINLSETELEGILSSIQSGARHDELASLVQRLRLQPLEQRLLPFADQVRELARRLGKCPVDVQVLGGDVRIPHKRWQGFLSACTHLVRNAVDHGLETPEERALAGKAKVARIAFTARMDSGDLVLEVRDDGRGIDPQQVAERAARLGLGVFNLGREGALLDLLCLDGFTTRESSTEYSGRGVGLSAVRAECERLGGVMMLTSERGVGTCFRFRFPQRALDLTGRLSSLPPATAALPA